MNKKTRQMFEVDEYIEILREKFKIRTGKEISRSKIVEICLKNLLKKVESGEGLQELLQEIEQPNR